MPSASLNAKQTTVTGLGSAVHRFDALTTKGVHERIFTYLFSGLVYPQIWEDPVVDMQALKIGPDDRLIAIASGGCNVLSYLTANPATIYAIDLNHAHIALNRLKLAAVKHLPGYEAFADFFVSGNNAANVSLYDLFLAARLDEQSRRYWGVRRLSGRRRISDFSKNIYATGLLGRFIGSAHLLGRLLGVDISILMQAKNLDEQKEIFTKKIAPLFDHKVLRTILRSPTSLYGLGIPPAQYDALVADHEHGLTGALRQRLSRLACDFPISENYFAQQAFGRGYLNRKDTLLPPYLQRENFEIVRSRADRIETIHGSLTDFLAKRADASLDCFVLLDAQDWMNDTQLNALWSLIDRTAAPGARVIFRTAADERLLPGRVSEHILSKWNYAEAESRELLAQDRSAIYGGFHLYIRAKN